MALGEQIRTARERLGSTQAYLAERVGVTPSYVTKLEKDEALPRYDLLVALANVLVLDSERLLALTERSRQERAGERIRTRGGMARGTFGIGAGAADPAGAARAAGTAGTLARGTYDGPRLQT